jgi:hypothetical protein
MPTSLIDSLVFRDIFATDAMRRAWSDESRTQRYPGAGYVLMEELPEATARDADNFLGPPRPGQR